MANYNIRTTRTQELGLNYTYDNFVDKTEFPTKESYLQNQIDTAVTNPMYYRQQQDQLVSFDKSFATVPETEQPAARTEIEGVITTHGGTIVPPAPPIVNPVVVPAPLGTSDNPIQLGGRTNPDNPS
jgi:hypothetical protein